MSIAAYRAWHDHAVDGVLHIGVDEYRLRRDLRPAADAVLYLSGLSVDESFSIDIERDAATVEYFERNSDGRLHVDLLSGELVTGTRTIALRAGR